MFVLAGQSNIGAWLEPENQPAIDAFREIFLGGAAEFSDVEFLPAFRGGSALLAEYARLNASEFSNDPDLEARVRANFWIDPQSDRFGRPMELAGERIDRLLARGGSVDAIIWAQGEADAFHLRPETLEAYASALAAVLGRLSDMCGNMPVFIQELGSLSAAGGAALVRRAQHHVADTMPGIVVATSTLDLPLRDAVHLSAEGHVEAARRMARAMAAAFGDPAG